ncbi:MAG: 5-formyltetrahydrofolate cyclo-ligase [Actinomycetota bacterium]|nr:5-formyltetrahydrofolate cyclo-ligase [Actinomycetota bacterium]
MDAQNSKAEWRVWAREVDRAAKSEDVTLALAGWPPLYGTVLSYLAMPDEIDLSRVHDLSRCRIAVTRTPREGWLTVHEYDVENLERHPLGFEQPTEDTPAVALDEIDVVLVPGFAFDRSGHRLGRGAGYYDGLLRRLPRGVIRVGITVDDLLVDDLPTEPHDQRISWVVTESRIQRVGDPISDASARVVDQAVEGGVAPNIHRFPEGTKTSQEAATAVGAEIGEIAKSILFEVDGEPVLAICSGDRRINEGKLARHLDAEVARIAPRDVVRETTGYVAGGTPSIGLPESLKVVADHALARYRWVWTAGGTPDTVYPVALERLIAASGASWADITDQGNM